MDQRARVPVLMAAIASVGVLAGVAIVFAARGQAPTATPIEHGQEAPATGPAEVTGSVTVDWAPECSTPVAVDLTPNGLSPAQAGFEPRLPGPGFTLERMVFRVHDGDCGGGPPSGSRVLRTLWKHEATGRLVSIQQQEGGREPRPTVDETVAFFDDGGYAFWVAAAKAFEVDDNLRAFPQPDGPPGRTGVDRPYGGDDQSQAALAVALQRLVPNGGDRCFIRNVRAGWPELAAAGLGDPRPAIPGDFRMIQFSFRRAEPPPGCDPSAWDAPAYTFSAKWASAGGRLLSVDVTRHREQLPDSGPQVEPGAISWVSRNTTYFVVTDPLVVAAGTGEAIARALDPAFVRGCTPETKPGTAGDLAAAGLRAPSPPPGWVAMETIVRTMASPAGCTPVSSGIVAQWMFRQADAGGIIVIGVASGARPAQRPDFLVPERSWYWAAANGRTWFVTPLKFEASDELLESFALLADPGFQREQLRPAPDWDEPW